MAIYRISSDKMKMQKLDGTTFEKESILEGELQNLLLEGENVKAIASDTLLIGKEVNVWDKDQCEIDLLGIDRESNLVVIEIKRDKTGKYMEWQALRYAAMVSTLTYSKLIKKHAEYLCNHAKAKSGGMGELKSEDKEKDARERIEEFLGGPPGEDQFGKKVRIILVSADFSPQLTTTVLWLVDNFQLDIRCVRMSPSTCNNDDGIFLEFRTIIPLPEAKEYQIRIKEMKDEAKKERKMESVKHDLQTQGDEPKKNLKCNALMFHLITEVLKDNGTPEKIEQIKQICKDVGRSYKVFEEYEGKLSTSEVIEKLLEGSSDPIRETRFYTEANELIYINNKTYAISTGWKCADAEKVAEQLEEHFHETFSKREIKVTKVKA